jgi:hypothetical protein
LSIAEASARDSWEVVGEPLLHLGFYLMDRAVSSREISEMDISCQIVCNLFSSHPALRAEIVDQLVSRIVLRENSSPLAIQSLDSLVRRSPVLLLDHAGKLKESISDLVNLPPWTSCNLLEAYLPLFRTRPDVRDFAFIALRKALFHREPSARAVASTGFLRIMSSSTPGATGCSSSNVVEEVVLPLRRALSHPPALRALLYKEARRLVRTGQNGSECLSMCNALRNLLHPHALRYIDASVPPFVVLEHCVNESGGGHLVEPLGDLISCLTAIELSMGKPLSRSYLLDLAKKVSSITMQDFDIYKETRANLGSSGAISDDEDDAQLNANEAANVVADRANRNRARVLGGVVESLINVALSVEESSQTVELYSDVVFPLLRLREELQTLLKSLGSGSPSDAFYDLGGDVNIEPVSLRSYGNLAGVGKSVLKGEKASGLGKKKQVGPKKAMNNTNAIGVHGSVSGDVGYRFGMFGVLVSNSFSPYIAIEAAAQCLVSMYPSSDELADSSRNLSNWFRTNIETSDVLSLSNFVRSAAKTHIEFAIETHSRSPEHLSLTCECSLLTSPICHLVSASMKAFQHHRGQTGALHTKNAVRALEFVKTCTGAICVLFMDDTGPAVELCHSMMPPNSRIEKGKQPHDVIDRTVESLEKVVESLVDDGLSKEADVMVQILASLCKLSERMPSSERKNFKVAPKLANWAADFLMTLESTDVGLMKGLIGAVTHPRANLDGMETTSQLAGRIHSVLGDCTAVDDVISSPSLNLKSLETAPIISQDNALQAVEIILRAIEFTLDEVEWALARMASHESMVNDQQATTKSKSRSRQDEIGAAVDQTSAEQLQRVVNKAEDLAQHRLEHVICALHKLLRSAIVKWSVQEQLVKCVTRCYRILSVAVNAQVRRRGDPRASFMVLIDVSKYLAPLVWQYMAFLSTNEKRVMESEGMLPGKSGPSAAKEARIMPQLVYEVEKFEKLLISAQKYTKIKLLSGMKRNTARDFRISADLFSDQERNSEGDDRLLGANNLSGDV